MNNVIVQNIIRWFLLVFFQVLIFKRIELNGGIFHYLQIILYPLFIILLPLRISSFLVMALAFVTGVVVDIFYDSIGVHAAALVFLAFIRPVVLSVLEPREGYNVNYSPTKKKLGMLWFMQYAGILIGAFLFFYFSVEAFTFVYIGDILLKTVLSFLVTMSFIAMYMLIFDPEQ